MNKSPLKQHFPVRFVVVLFPIIFIIFVLAPAAYFLVNKAQVEAEERAQGVIDLEAARIADHLEKLLTVPQNINEINAHTIQQNLLDYHSLETLQTYFLGQVKIFETVSSIYFANPQGGLADAGREPETDTYYRIDTAGFVAGDFHKYALDIDGKPSDLLLTVPDFDARKRAWYRNAVEAEGVVWSDAYVLFTGQDMAISASCPVFTTDGKFLGVVATDIFLAEISVFLNKEPIGKTGQSFIIDRSGNLLATSTKQALFFEEDGNYVRVNLSSSDSALMREIGKSAALTPAGLDKITSAQQSEFFYNGERIFVDVRPVGDEYGINWISVVILPESDFIDIVIDHRRIIIIVFVLLSVIEIGLELVGARWLLKPLIALNHSVEKFSVEWKADSLPHTRITEIEQLGQSFNVMAKRLSESLAALNLEIDEHKQAKKNLAASEIRYRSAVEDSPGLLCSFLPSGEITFVNQSYAEYYRTTPEKLIGTNFLDLLPEEERLAVREKITELNIENPLGVVTQNTFSPAGELHHQRWINRALFDKDGDIIGYQSFGEDIEDEYKTQALQSALYRIAQAANHMESLDDFYGFVHEIVADVIAANNFYIVLYHEEEDLLYPVYYADEMDAKHLPLKPEHSPSAYVLKNRTSLRCTPEEFFALQPDFHLKPENGTPPAIWMGIPLVVDARTIGIMAVQDYHREKAYGQSEQEFLEVISSSVAATIVRLRAEEEILNYAQTNALLLRAARELNETLDLKQIYRVFHAILNEVMDCDTFTVSSYDPKDQMISASFVIHEGKERDISQYPRIPLEPEGFGVQSRVIRNGEPLYINHFSAYLENINTAYFYSDDGKFYAQKESPKDEVQIESVLAAALKLSGQPVGAIQVMSYRINAFVDEQLRFLEMLATQVSLSLHNAHLYQQARNEITLRTQAEEKLQRLNADLETRVQKRTVDLDERVRAVEKLNAGMSNILHDLNLANKLAEKTARDLRNANVELEAFSYSVSHDLRAPLRHIESFSRLLEKHIENSLDAEGRRYLENILFSTEKMRDLINDLLTLSRTSKADFRLKPVDFNSIIENILAEEAPEVTERQIAWKIAPLPTVQADTGLISIVWTNLIENAIKYTRFKQNAAIEIGVVPPAQADHPNPQQTFFIRDNGVGFDKTYADKLFGVFQRLHREEEFEGTGIGLATVRRIIYRHGGEVWAEGDIDKGATFYFSLPMKDFSGK